MPTPSSSAAAYSSVADMKDRYDLRTLCQLASRTDTPLSEEALAQSPVLLKALKGASGEVEAAVSVGKAYLAADLAALTGVALEYLKDLVCALALGRMYLNRPDRKAEAPASVDQAREVLRELRDGQLVFGLLEQQAAGNISDVVEKAIDVERRGGIVVQATRYFSRRGNRLNG